MRALLALLLLAAAAGAGLNPLPLLAIAFVGGSGMAQLVERRLKSEVSGSNPAPGSAHEQVIATIYERQGRLVLRRRKVYP